MKASWKWGWMRGEKLTGNGSGRTSSGTLAHALLRFIRPEFVLWASTLFLFCLQGGLFLFMGWEGAFWTNPGYELLNHLGQKTQIIILFFISFIVALLPLTAYRWVTKDSNRWGRYLECVFLWGTSYVVASALVSNMLALLLVNMLVKIIYATALTPAPYGVDLLSAFPPTWILFLPALGILVLAKDIMLKTKWICYAINLALAVVISGGYGLVNLLID